MAAPSREGEILDGKYRILRKLGEGGMGAVYAGENIRVKKTVAIKILHASAGQVEEMAQRFEKEAQAAGQIGNDHIVEVHDLGMTSAGERYMVMEYLDGESLRARIRRQKRMVAHEILPIMVQMLEGLEAAHRAGIVHRDLKPDNIYLVKSRGRAAEFVKVLDFGISKFAGGDGSTTQAGTVMGSPNYMSPEHVKSSSEVDARSDVYAVGVMLFEALTGAVPRKAANFAELLFRVAYEPLPDPRTLVPTLPEALVAVINRACATAPGARFQSAHELSCALDELLLVLPAPSSSANIPAPAPSSPSAFGGAQLSASQPSYQALSTPAFNAASQPSFGGASPSLEAFSRSNPALSARSLGPNADPGLAMGTEVISVSTSGSQPSFAGPPQSIPGASQPSFGSGSQPSFGSGSQPSFSSASHSPTSASQPSYTSGSQPSYGGSSQVGMGTTAGVALGPALESGAPSRPKRGATVALLVGLGVGALGLGAAALYVALGSEPAPAVASATPPAASTNSAPAAATPATSTLASAAPAASIEPSASAESVASASSSATPIVKPPPVRFGGRRKIPDPGY